MYQKVKVYSDGSHYIGIPYEPNPRARRPRPRREELISIKETPETEENAPLPVETSTEEKENVLEPNCPPPERKMTRKELFNELYQSTIGMKKRERKVQIKAKLRPYFRDDASCRAFVEENFARKHRNMICRKIRLWRKINHQKFNYFVTVTYFYLKRGSEMIDKSRLKEMLAAYKEGFTSWWQGEKYKWVAVKWFQDHWDLNAPDFAAMLNLALQKTGNLLTSYNNYPKGMIVELAKSSPESVRAMFTELFDKGKDVIERISIFKEKADDLLQQYGKEAKQHYQYENAITTYLWLRYPDKYYIYKPTLAKTVSAELGAGLSFKKGAYEDNLRNFFALYDEMNAAIREDEELISLFRSQLSRDCYPDPECRTLTIDLGYFIGEYVKHKAPVKEKWLGTEFDPGLSEEDWERLLKDESVFTPSALEIMARMKDFGGEATCKQLSLKYGEEPNFYNAGSTSLAQRVCKAANLQPFVREDGSTQWWTVLYTGRYADKEEEGNFVWRLREDLSAALDKVDLGKVKLYAENGQSQNYWWLNANPNVWSLAGFAVGQEQSYTLYNDKGNPRRVFQNFLDAKAGDWVIGYESKPTLGIVAICKVSKPQDGTSIYFEKVEALTSPIDYATFSQCPELQNMQFLKNPQGSLFKLTKDEFEFIMSLIRAKNPAPSFSKPMQNGNQTSGDVAHDPSGEDVPKSFDMPKQEIPKGLEEYLHQNVIFYGVPGCGKSHFIDGLLKDSQENKMDETYYKRILFHPEYSYSDFVGQIMPTVKDNQVTYEFEAGPFVEILADALADPAHQYILIIEEINRGNAPAIFGDLFQLLDRKRDGESEYAIYNKAILNSNEFKKLNPKPASVTIPENLTILATMNTCDQNVFTLDTAFKRRWRMCRIENDFTKACKNPIGALGFTWPEFAEAVNQDMLDNCNDGTAAEDKLLGAFFVKEDDIADARRFAEKVLMYLWNDVVNYDRSRLFDVNNYKTLDQAIKGFVKGENVFSPNCNALKKLYEDAQSKTAPQPETGPDSGTAEGKTAPDASAAQPLDQGDEA